MNGKCLVGSALLSVLCMLPLMSTADVAKSLIKIEPIAVGDGVDIDAQQLTRGLETLKTEVLKSGKYVIFGDNESQDPDLCMNGSVLSCQCQPINAKVGDYTFTAFKASCEIRMTFVNGLTKQELKSDVFSGSHETKAKRIPEAALPQAARAARSAAIDDAMIKVVSFLSERSDFDPPPSLENIEVFLLEEPPTQGQLKMAAAFGSGLDGQKFFLANYGVMQRKIRDLLVLRLGESGADVKLLEGNDAYASFKTKDQMLVGVYFDPEKNEFAIDDDLINEVKANNPEAIVVYYRIDAMAFDASDSKMHIGVSMNLRNFAYNFYEPYASLPSVEFSVETSSKEVVMDKIATETAHLFDRIWKANGKGSKIVAISRKVANAGQGRPLVLQINPTVFDAKERKRILYNIKKELVARKLCTTKDVKTLNNSFRATIIKSDIENGETLYMEYLLPMLQGLGLELTDDQVSYSVREVLIKPGQESAQ